MEYSACAECGHETAGDHLIQYGDATICVFCAEDNHSHFGPSLEDRWAGDGPSAEVTAPSGAPPGLS